MGYSENTVHCDLCEDEILDGEKHIRVMADVATKKGENITSLITEPVIVFACFHEKCLADSIGEDIWDDKIAYLSEAQLILEAAKVDLTQELVDNEAAEHDSHVEEVTPRSGGLRILSGGKSEKGPT